jgi:putative addiction module component (TIGR02574 family)
MAEGGRSGGGSPSRVCASAVHGATTGHQASPGFVGGCGARRFVAWECCGIVVSALGFSLGLDPLPLCRSGLCCWDLVADQRWQARRRGEGRRLREAQWRALGREQGCSQRAGCCRGRKRWAVSAPEPGQEGGNIMTTLVGDVFRQALALDERDRATLAELLLESLEPDGALFDPNEIESAWQEEIQRRVAEIDAGRAALVSWEDVQARIRRILGA